MSTSQREPDPLSGLTQPAFESLSRVPIRVRENKTTTAGWRLMVRFAQGPGSIELADTVGGTYYRGAGVFLGWSQERLAAAHARLRPAPPAAQSDSGQWG
jgi:hypothetical protein